MDNLKFENVTRVSYFQFRKMLPVTVTIINFEGVGEKYLHNQVHGAEIRSTVERHIQVD